jgi:hypothetical protein
MRATFTQFPQAICLTKKKERRWSFFQGQSVKSKNEPSPADFTGVTLDIHKRSDKQQLLLPSEILTKTKKQTPKWVAA